MTKASQHKLLKGFCLYFVGTARFELATPRTPFRVKQNQSPANAVFPRCSGRACRTLNAEMPGCAGPT
jgi:hypothetical protein